jgi:hypothetical protein
MNLQIRGLRLAVFALCGTALVACNSVEDVRESPAFPIPTEKVALSGTITGLGVSTTRPVELTMAITKDHPYLKTDDPDGDGVRTVVLSVRGVKALDFGALDVGATYRITVTKQPFGRVCTPVAMASGTVAAEYDSLGKLKPIAGIEIQCNRDATALFHVTANFPALAGNLPAGFKLTLKTEEGQQEVIPAASATSVTFSDFPVLYPGANPPAFAYQVTATNTVNGTVNSCSITNGSGELGTGSGDVTNVTVTGCLFSVAATASYSAPPGGAAGTIATGGVLGLRNKLGNIVNTAPLTSGAAVTLGTNLPSNADALYEVVVTTQPPNQFCTVDNGGLASLVPSAYVDDPTTPGRDPKLTPANPANVATNVRCRDIPAAPSQLTGTYQVVRSVPAATVAIPRPLATATDRHFMTFFANGTFLYGVHHATPTSPAGSAPLTGVEHGFYSYNPGAGTLAFTVVTDSSSGGACSGFGGSPACPAGTTFASGFGTAFMPAVATSGLSGISGFSMPLSFTTFFFVLPGSVSATNVTKTAAIPGVAPLGGEPSPADPGLPAVGPQLSLTFGTATWTLVQPISATWEWNDSVYPGVADEPFWSRDKMAGAWVTPDSKQVWIYDSVSLNGWHAGVNGAPNLQDSCFPIELRSTDFGYDRFYAPRSSGGFGTACNPGAVGLIDTPSTISTPALVPGFAGRMPGSIVTTVQVPSPVYFRVAPGATSGAPDTLTVQGTQNDVPVGAPLVFTRSVAN